MFVHELPPYKSMNTVLDEALEFEMIVRKITKNTNTNLDNSQIVGFSTDILLAIVTEETS